MANNHEYITTSLALNTEYLNRSNNDSEENIFSQNNVNSFL